MKILHRDQLPLGGFAGVTEHRLVTDSRVWGKYADPFAWQGIGNFVYLADARFLPQGQTGLHSHHEIDVISFMLEGRIAHEGSLEHGELLQDYDVQVQRAGAQGFQHNEVNPDDVSNRMIQMWVLPESAGDTAAYRKYSPVQSGITQIYGGETSQTEFFPAKTQINVARLDNEQNVSVDGSYMAYLCVGAGSANGAAIREGHLLSGSSDLAFTATEPSYLILIQSAI